MSEITQNQQDFTSLMAQLLRQNQSLINELTTSKAIAKEKTETPVSKFKKNKEPEISIETQFSNWCKREKDLRRIKQTIYQWDKAYWRELDSLELLELAEQFLSVSFTSKNRPSLKRSCILQLESALPKLHSQNTIILPFKNCYLHITKNGVEQKDVDKEQGLRYLIPCDYVGNLDYSQSMHWKKFLDEAVPNVDIQEFLQEWTGYSLVKQYSPDKMLYLCGDGGNGKGVFTKCISALHECRKGIMFSDLKSECTLYSLQHATLITVEEVNKVSENEQIVKNLTGGGVINCRKLYGDPLSCTITGKWIINLNHIPRSPDQCDGFWRRNFYVPFPHKIKPVNPYTIIDQDLESIAYWAVEGLKRIVSRGLEKPILAIPGVLNAFKEQIMTENCVVRSWWTEVSSSLELTLIADLAGAKNEEDWTLKSVVYEHFQDFTKRSGQGVVGEGEFWKRLKNIPELKGSLEERRLMKNRTRKLYVNLKHMG